MVHKAIALTSTTEIEACALPSRRAYFALASVPKITHPEHGGGKPHRHTENDLTPLIRPIQNTIWAKERGRADESQQAHGWPVPIFRIPIIPSKPEVATGQPLLPAQSQIRLAIDTMHTLVVDAQAFAAQQYMQTPIAEAQFLASQRDQTLSQAVVVLPRHASICLTAVIICASVCLLLDIPSHPPEYENRARFCGNGDQATLWPRKQRMNVSYDPN